MPTNVLVVDDVIATCHVLARCLAVIGANVECAESGMKALKSMAQIRPSLVFLDYMMPEMDGLEVLRRMRADVALKTIPVVMFTANESAKFRAEAEQLGAIGILIKGNASLNDFQQYVSLVQ